MDKLTQLPPETTYIAYLDGRGTGVEPKGIWVQVSIGYYDISLTVLEAEPYTPESTGVQLADTLLELYGREVRVYTYDLDAMKQGEPSNVETLIENIDQMGDEDEEEVEDEEEEEEEL